MRRRWVLLTVLLACAWFAARVLAETRRSQLLWDEVRGAIAYERAKTRALIEARQAIPYR